MQAYSETFKRQMCEEYLRTGVKKTELLRKYHIGFRSAVQTWMKQLGYEDIYRKALKSSTLTAPILSAEYTSNQAPPEPEDLEKRVKELERLLQEEQLRAAAYQRMIELAEKELHISIKKSNVAGNP